jgi:hypothetical protein
VNNYCCPNGNVLNLDGNTCISICDSGQFILNNQCVTACLQTTKYIDVNVCGNYCPNNKVPILLQNGTGFFSCCGNAEVF